MYFEGSTIKKIKNAISILCGETTQTNFFVRSRRFNHEQNAKCLLESENLKIYKNSANPLNIYSKSVF